jgi:hypothetical protein
VGVRDESVFARSSRRPLLDFTPVDLDRRRTFGAHKVVVMCGSARSIRLLAATGDSIGRALFHQGLEGPVHRCERGRVLSKEGVKLLGRNEIGGRRQRAHNCCALFGGAFHTTSLVVVLYALDVDVIVVMFDAVFTVQFVMNLLAQPWQQPPLEDDTVKECDENDVENDLPKDFGENVRRVKGDGNNFIPKGKCFFVFVCLSGERSYVHSPSIALLRMIVNN